jgi:hypothetical protein
MELHVIKNFISKEDSQIIISYIEKRFPTDDLPRTRQTVMFGKDNLNKSSSPVVYGIDEVEDLVRKYTKEATKTVRGIFERDLEIFLSSFWLSKHYPGATMRPHSDTDSGKSPQYCNSGILYLNGQETGGELFFPKIDLLIKPEQGDLILFDARHKDAIHGVKKVNEFRYTIPMWFTDSLDYILD